MRRFGFRLALAAVSMVWLAVSPVAAGKISDYKGDMVSLDPSGKVESSTKVYASGGKLRMEIPPQEGMDGMVMIMRPDKKVHWILFPDSKTYMEQALDEKAMPESLKAMGITSGKDKEEDLGSEKVNGYQAKKKRITSTSTVMGQTYTNVSTVWIAEEFDIPLREKDESGAVEEFRNISEGAQPAALFEIPKGFTKSTGMPGMPGMGGMEDMDEMPEGMQLPEGIQLPPGMKMPKQ